MYGHGVASIALAEVYGQTKDPRVRPKLEQVIRTIIESQNAEGGWRYNPRPNDADISVTVLQVVALRAAKNAGLDIPQVTIDRAVKYVTPATTAARVDLPISREIADRVMPEQRRRSIRSGLRAIR
jgi:uncharacterized protein YfaS (alpha-2-macroglobulin family)